LDARQAVGYDVYKDGKLLKTYCCCATCWDGYEDDLGQKVLGFNGGDAKYRVEVTDGRELWPSGKPRPRPRRTSKKKETKSNDSTNDVGGGISGGGVSG
jgi:hypothetical protein